MADEEAEQDTSGSPNGSLGAERGLLDMPRLKERLLSLEAALRESDEGTVEAAIEYCHQLCQVWQNYRNTITTASELSSGLQSIHSAAETHLFNKK
uniref:Uncharacterized protein n=1 Tax=Sphaerodactylus townsendi TaxID=933632 RepID=A0ACB8GD19_9SAUR